MELIPYPNGVDTSKFKKYNKKSFKGLSKQLIKDGCVNGKIFTDEGLWYITPYKWQVYLNVSFEINPRCTFYKRFDINFKPKNFCYRYNDVRYDVRSIRRKVIHLDIIEIKDPEAYIKCVQDLLKDKWIDLTGAFQDLELHPPAELGEFTQFSTVNDQVVIT